MFLSKALCRGRPGWAMGAMAPPSKDVHVHPPQEHTRASLPIPPMHPTHASSHSRTDDRPQGRRKKEGGRREGRKEGWGGKTSGADDSDQRRDVGRGYDAACRLQRCVQRQKQRALGCVIPRSGRQTDLPIPLSMQCGHKSGQLRESGSRTSSQPLFPLSV